MGRGGHYIYLLNESGQRIGRKWMSNKKLKELHEKSASQRDAMTQRRYKNEEQAAGAIKIGSKRGSGNTQNKTPDVLSVLNQKATNATEMRARRKAIDSLSREQIENEAGRLNQNQFTLLNKNQQKWYSDATEKQNELTKILTDAMEKDMDNFERTFIGEATKRGYSWNDIQDMLE